MAKVETIEIVRAAEWLHANTYDHHAERLDYDGASCPVCLRRTREVAAKLVPGAPPAGTAFGGPSAQRPARELWSAQDNHLLGVEIELGWEEVARG